MFRINSCLKYHFPNLFALPSKKNEALEYKNISLPIFICWYEWQKVQSRWNLCGAALSRKKTSSKQNGKNINSIVFTFQFTTGFRALCEKPKKSVSN
jgi:hypothetical protein